MSDDQKEQTPEPERGKEDKPEVFSPRPREKVDLNSEQLENKEKR